MSREIDCDPFNIVFMESSGRWLLIPIRTCSLFLMNIGITNWWLGCVLTYKRLKEYHPPLDLELKALPFKMRYLNPSHPLLIRKTALECPMNTATNYVLNIQWQLICKIIMAFPVELWLLWLRTHLRPPLVSLQWIYSSWLMSHLLKQWVLSTSIGTIQVPRFHLVIWEGQSALIFFSLANTR